ncbi:MAG: Crp/Fnr family transcriptional regulator [Saprospiraceae bacterium]|nr:Crp/Fnr family transcriptional regulator [Saprospiraceae bacterium]
MLDTDILPYIDLIAAHTTPIQCKAGDRFPNTGESERIVAFITEGVFRVYSVDQHGKELILRFAAEGEFTLLSDDYKGLNPDAEYYWEALTDTTLLTWRDKDLEVLVNKIPGWYSISLKIMETLIYRLVIERAEMFNDDATTRYRKFIQRYPDTITRVPLRCIANYLGIAPQSLSRIRHQLANSNNN